MTTTALPPPVDTNIWGAVTRRTDIQGLAEDVARLHHLSPGVLMNPTGTYQHRRASDARRVMATVLRYNGFSLPVIGRHMNRHHTTILWSLRVGLSPAHQAQVG